jgi:hypothetical protein
MVGTRFFEHFVENAPVEGSSRLLVVSCSDKVISHGFALALLVLLLLLLLLLVVPLGASIGVLWFLVLALLLILVTIKDGTNCLLVDGVVGDDIHHFVDSGRSVTTQLSD